MTAHPQQPPAQLAVALLEGLVQLIGDHRPLLFLGEMAPGGRFFDGAPLSAPGRRYVTSCKTSRSGRPKTPARWRACLGPPRDARHYMTR